MQQLRCGVLFNLAGLMLLSQASSAGAVSLVPMEEPVTTLVSPIGGGNGPSFVTPMQYTYNAISGAIATTVTATPLLCANTSQPLVEGTLLNPVYYSSNGGGASPPMPFVFGAALGSPTVSAMAKGAQNVSMSPTQMNFVGDDTGSLVCYGLNADGTRRLTRDVFEDGVDGSAFNSTIVLSTFHLPSQAEPYYSYTIDVTIPPLPANTNCSANGLDCNFVIEEGYDTSVFDTANGGWCQASPGATQCQFSTTAGDVNMIASAPIAPASALNLRFIVFRQLRAGATLPATGAPVAIAALFSPNDLDENKLDDNVSAGNNTLANAAPSIAQDTAFAVFAGSLAALSENADSGTLTFDITDADTAENGSTLGATAMLNLPNNIAVPLTANCSTLLSSPGTTPVSRACTIDIPLNNSAFWNAQVSPVLDNLFNVVATDTTNGLYAPGISASNSNVSIVVTDPLGKSSIASTVPVHIHSTVNNAPTITYGTGFVQASDPNNGKSYATYSCSIAAGANVGGCGAAVRGVIEVDLLASVTSGGGPPAAFDEVASQTTAVVPFSDPNDTYTNVQCTPEQATGIFASDGGPIVAASPGSTTTYDMNFLLPTTPPPSAVSALCGLSITDVGPYPNGEIAAKSLKQFRVVVNP